MSNATTTGAVSASSSITISTPTITGTTAGSAQGSEGITLITFVTALSTAVVVFGVQLFAFLLLKNKLARIYKPKTFLVPERERTEAPPRSPWGWIFSIFRFRDREIINKCGLDAYFFLRYLQTLLTIFIPLGIVILPILVPLNYMSGRGAAYALEFGNSSSSSTANVTGLDQLAWGNVRPTHTKRYWAHLILALVVIIWVCGVFFWELRVYVKVRQDYLTSAEHRLRASATTVLVSAIPTKWLTEEALSGLYDVFPGGIRNIWINRKFDDLLDKIHLRDKIFKKLEGAETELIRSTKKAQKKQLEKDEKKNKSSAMKKSYGKEEKAAQLKRDNDAAERLALEGGTSTVEGGHVPHTVNDAIDEEEERARHDPGVRSASPEERNGAFKVPILGGGFAAVGHGLGAMGQGIGRGFGVAGDTVIGGARNIATDLDNQVETTNGFVHLDTPSPNDDSYDQYGRYRGSSTSPYGSGVDRSDEEPTEKKVTGGETTSVRSSNEGHQQKPGFGTAGNQTRKANFGADGTDDLTSSTGWWKFWQGPSGGFPSPIPVGFEEGDEFPLTAQTDGSKDVEKKGLWSKIKAVIPFLGSEEPALIDYPAHFNAEYKENASTAVWEKYIKAKDRPTHRNPRFSWTPDWFFGIPFISPEVDTIYWCRGELARLNLEIETDQQHPERFPLMNSAFIQFNHQVAAHMCAQSITHHVPQMMAPRAVEISPKDVLWDNMSIKWWESWLRTGIVTIIVAGMIILWAIPVAWTATLGQLASMADKYSWLHWLNAIPKKYLQAIAGVLPALVLAILLAVVPLILSFLAVLEGSQTGRDKARSVQNYYFAFLFVQVFLVVSISGGITATLTSTAKDITSIPSTLATQLPKAANYFFSYMILQALSTASGTLLQVFTLLMWYLLPKLFDNTARQKWTRNTSLPSISWGTFFPVYTNFACIAIIYSVVAPIIIIFAVITFSLLWIAHRYNMLYVTRFELDTGGLLYPRAINQTFTGLYVMEICMIGLFFLVRDAKDQLTCTPQAIIMIVAVFLTVIYQVLLNMAFGPLFQHLPITFEDEAVIRDQAFERAQARRLGLEDEDVEARLMAKDDDIEMTKVNPNKFAKLNPVNVISGAGSWAFRSGRKIKAQTLDTKSQPQPRLRRRHKDADAQKRIADALYGDMADDIEDLTPDERDVLVRHAFQHYALRARRPTVWIPRDDIGVSDDEVRRTREFAGTNVWISNVGAALDGKGRVVYGRNPPDFSEVDVINL